ncbi:MFS transporter [Echinicola soli]|uniref:MFS transporter n=1 Tax=Echinicola soli TaxID=2591634 RepID=A0A514CK44_9BACT|nr:MFS transporter [Echinicola soli]QDH80221.1 MFS transporter [Echinicola soli]
MADRKFNSIIRGYRWRIVALLFLATAVKYIDRNVLSFTMIDEGFRREMLNVSESSPLSADLIGRFKILMGYVDASFKFAYAIGFVLMGYFIDRVLVKKGYSIAIAIWSFAGIVTAFVSSFRGLSITRFAFGFGESANFPAAIKTIAEWFPKKERSFATGIYNAGANVGIMATALIVPALIINLGWRWSFLCTGLLGVILLICWRMIYRPLKAHPKVNAEEQEYINSDKEIESDNAKVPWKSLMKTRGAWAIALGKFFTDPVWWFYLTWLPDFFNSNEALETKLNLSGLALPFIFIYFTSDLGSVFFGWLSGKFISMGWSVNKSRKLTLLLCALLVVPLMFAAKVSNVYLAMVLVALAAAAHQGWSANLFTLSSDIFPKRVVGSVVGLAGMVGGIGGTIFAAFAGIILVNWGYFPIFIMASASYLIALLIIHLLVPRIR